MRKILKNRGHGKTYDCVKMCIDNNAILVVPYRSLMKHAEWLARKEFNTEIRIVSFNDFITGKLKGCRNEKFVFDDIDWMIRNLIGANELIGLSMNMEDIQITD